MNATQVLAVVNKVFNQYGVQVSAEYGVDAPSLAMILTTKIFEEAAGVNKPSPARRPLPVKPIEIVQQAPVQTLVPAESAKVTIKQPVAGKEKTV